MKFFHPATRKQDNINPSHYTQGGIQSIDYMKAKLTPEEYQGFLKGNIIKYITREKLKMVKKTSTKRNGTWIDL